MSRQYPSLYFVLTPSRHTTISGGIAIQAGFLVSFKQLVPEHTVAIAKGLIRMRVKHFPAIFLLANTISGMILGTETAMFLAYFGFFTAWIYLRFYRISPSLSSTATGDGSVIRGDASDTFSFAHFFPEPIQTPVGALSDGIYNALVSLKVCTPFSDRDIDAGNEQASARAEGGLPSIMNPNSRGGSRWINPCRSREETCSGSGSTERAIERSGISRPKCCCSISTFCLWTYRILRRDDIRTRTT